MWQGGSMADDGRRADTVLYLPFPLCLNLAVSGVFLGCSFLSFFFFSFDLGPPPLRYQTPHPPLWHAPPGVVACARVRLHARG